MILDIYTHLFPPKYLDRLSRSGTGLGGLAARMKGTPQVVDVEPRFREMDKYDAYAQVLALPHPVIEEVAPAHQAEDLARLANDEMAEIVTQHPDRFPAWVATVVLTDVDAAIKEADRAIRDLGARDGTAAPDCVQHVEAVDGPHQLGIGGLHPGRNFLGLLLKARPGSHPMSTAAMRKSAIC